MTGVVARPITRRRRQQQQQQQLDCKSASPHPHQRIFVTALKEYCYAPLLLRFAYGHQRQLLENEGTRPPQHFTWEYTHSEILQYSI